MSDRIQYIVHSSVYDKPSGEGIDVYRELSHAVRNDLRYHYSGPVCAGHWLDLCQSPDYGHGRLIRDIDSIFDEVVAATREARPECSSIELISLGPGDGEIDTQLLTHIQRAARLAGYVGVDVSFELLQCAIGKIVASKDIAQDFPVTGIWADFTRSPELPRKRQGCARIVALTGFTLGNHRESVLLERIGGIVEPGDLLFLDAQLHPLDPPISAATLEDEEIELLVTRYRTNSVNQFAFGPVELVTTMTAADVDFDYEVNQETTTVPNALNVVTYCKNLNTRLRLNGCRIQMPRLDLASATIYRYSDFAQWFKTVGFDVIYKARTEGAGFFLLSPSKRSTVQSDLEYELQGH